MYTGAMENHPAVIEAISQSRALWGNSAAVVRPVRDPWNVAAVVRQAGLQFPEIRVLGTEVPPPGYWVLKPLRSGGGRKIRLLSVSADASVRSPSIGNASVFYLQRQVLGQAYGAVYLGDGQRRCCSESLNSLSGVAGRERAASGIRDRSGRSHCKPDQMRQFIQLGQCLTSEFSLRAVWRGYHCRQDRRMALEVNPRYTASVEVLERCLEIPVIRWHAVACSEGRLPPEPPAHTGTFWGKAVLYARRPLVVTGRFCEFVTECEPAQCALPEVADVPAEGTRIRPGQPIVSIFANGRSMAESRVRLRTSRGSDPSAIGRPAAVT